MEMLLSEKPVNRTRRRTLQGVIASWLLACAGPLLGQASVLSKAKRTSESIEPSLAFPEQESAAQGKLRALRSRTAKRPNIVWLVIDDMGWGDVGVYMRNGSTWP
jgi:arylsulfatase